MIPKVSVIVPVYKTEKYLEKCLDSLVAQTLEEIEIIIVNDGSPDHSQKMIDDYARRHPTKIIPVIKKNGGLGDARNHGLKLAKGEYIGFVDSDDWIDTAMFETLYQTALEGHDLIVCDCVAVTDGEENGHIAKGFRGPWFDHRQAVIYATDPAFACNKLFKRNLFMQLQFSEGWYEDIGTIPVLMTYARSPAVVERPLYYYRQRPDSITGSADRRTLGVIDAWERILAKANPDYREEIVYAVARSIDIFIGFKSLYAEEFLEFAEKYKARIANNSYYQDAVKTQQVRDLFNTPIIPKKIHYCWFGYQQKPALIKRCIQTWREQLPNYTIIEWNETNCDLNENDYIKQAYSLEKWAFVTDYIRLKVLFEQGGIYLDADVEITGNLDEYRFNQTFFAFETANFIQTGIIGSVKKAPIIKKLMKPYQTEKFLLPDGTLNDKTNVVRITEWLTEQYDLKWTGLKQVLQEGVVVFPANQLTIDLKDGENRAIHHYESSWKDVKTGSELKQAILDSYFNTTKPQTAKAEDDTGGSLSQAQEHPVQPLPMASSAGNAEESSGNAMLDSPPITMDKGSRKKKRKPTRRRASSKHRTRSRSRTLKRRRWIRRRKKTVLLKRKRTHFIQRRSVKHPSRSSKRRSIKKAA